MGPVIDLAYLILFLTIPMIAYGVTRDYLRWRRQQRARQLERDRARAWYDAHRGQDGPPAP